tara:strand:- start:13 stop:720 length:708 start_codon:yes stop_codon:yes gene_type:complete
MLERFVNVVYWLICIISGIFLVIGIGALISGEFFSFVIGMAIAGFILLVGKVVRYIFIDPSSVGLSPSRDALGRSAQTTGSRDNASVHQLLLSDYLLERGWQKEWFNDTGAIAQLDIDPVGMLPVLRKQASAYYQPFYKKDRKVGRRLFLRDIFTPGRTQMLFSATLENNPAFEAFIEKKRGVFQYDCWYLYSYPDFFNTIIPDPFVLTNCENEQEIFEIGAPALTWIDSIFIRN